MQLFNFGSIASQGRFWLPGYAYGREYTIPVNSVDASQVNFPCRLYLNSSNFDFSKCKVNGSDIRFTDRSNSLLKYEKKQHEQGKIIFDGIDDCIVPNTDIGNLHFLYRVGTTGVWTVRAKYKANSFAAIQTFLAYGNYKSGYHNMGIALNADRSFTVIINGAAAGAPVISFTTAAGIYPNDTLYEHEVEVSYNQSLASNNCKIFIDGNLVAQGSKTANAAYTGTYTTTCLIGSYSGNGAGVGDFLNGIISEFEISTTVRHSSSFIPSTNFVVSDTYTRFLIRFNESGVASIIGSPGTIYGAPAYVGACAVYDVLVPSISNVKNTNFYMWYGNSSAYNDSIEAWQDKTGKPLTYSGNVKLEYNGTYGRRVASFDGVGDYITVDNILPSLPMFTIEANIYIDNTQQSMTLFDCASHTRLVISLNRASYTTGTTCVFIGDGSTWLGAPAIVSSNQLSVGWHNITVNCEGSTTRLFHDGIPVGQTSITPTLLQGARMRIGALAIDGNESENFKGLISGYRVTNDLPDYITHFTPPTEFKINKSKVVFCTEFDTIYDQNYSMVQHMGDSLVDATGNGNNGAVAGATIANTSYGKARVFNGTSSDYITIVDSTLLDNLNFTLMTFIKPYNVVPVNAVRKIITKRNGASEADWEFTIGSSNIDLTIYMTDATGNTSTSGAILSNNVPIVPSGRWDGTINRIYLDGTILNNISTAGKVVKRNSQVRLGNSVALEAANRGFYGEQFEIRMSNIARSDAWIKLESLSLKNSLLTYKDL